MASTRPLKLDEWGISWEEYKELTYFCLQYSRKKQEAAALLTIRSTTPSPVVYHKGGKEYGAFMPHGNAVGDPVAAVAAKRERLLADVRMIEQAAVAASADYNVDPRYILSAVTRRGGVQSMYAKDRPPIGERQFYELRRKFYWILHSFRESV